MKILYDYQAFQMQRFGGISRYFCELMEKFAKADHVTPQLAMKYSQNEYLKASTFSRHAVENPDSYENFLGKSEFRGKWSLYQWRNKLRKPVDSSSENRRLSIEALERQDFDIFHPTYYDDYFLPHIGEKPFVLTVHDMIHEIYPEYFNPGDPTSVRKRNLAHKATRIIAISECTKADLIDCFQIPADKIQVIHHGNSMATNTSIEVHGTSSPSRYLLFVGSRSIYKNFYFFVTSIVPLLDADPNLHVVCAGSPFDKRERQFFELHGVTGKLHSYQASDAELIALYRQALAFVFPSIYEGFGLPVLEAFGSCCPVVLANAASLPEVGGDAAVYFEPKSASSMRSAISEAISGGKKTTELIDRGKDRLKLFSWEKTASETYSFYRDIL